MRSQGPFETRSKHWQSHMKEVEHQRLAANDAEGDNFDAAMVARDAALKEAMELERKLDTAHQNVALAKLETLLKCIFLTQRRPAEQLLVYAVNDPTGRFTSAVAHLAVHNTLNGRDMNTVSQWVIWKLAREALALNLAKTIDVVDMASDGASQMVWSRNHSGRGSGEAHSLVHLPRCQGTGCCRQD